MAIIEMTREEYEKKFGSTPGSASVSTPQTKAPQKPLVNKVTDLLGLKGATDLVGATLAHSPFLGQTFTPNTASGESAKKNVEFPTGKEALGGGISGLSFAVPGGGGLLSRAVMGGITGYGLDVGSKLQSGDESPLTPGSGTAWGVALPPVLSVGSRVLGSLLRGTGSAFSGASQKAIRAVEKGPGSAMKTAQDIESHPLGMQEGQDAIVRNNAKTIVDGIVAERRTARKIYGDALEELSAEEIKPDVFRASTQKFLDDNGIYLKDGVRNFDNVEFTNQKNIDKASALVDRLSNTDLDGKSLRKLSDDIENAQYTTTATDAERLSFNHFLENMGSAIRSAINESTPRLKAMDAQYSKDMNLLKSVQNIFGQIKYGNRPEVESVARNLEGLFTRRGADASTIDEFLTRIKVNPVDFRASEASRQIGNIEPKANSTGANIGELLRAVTGSVISPKAVRNIAIMTGMTEKVLQPFLEALSPVTRVAVLQVLLQGQGEGPEQGQLGRDMLQSEP